MIEQLVAKITWLKKTVKVFEQTTLVKLPASNKHVSLSDKR